MGAAVPCGPRQCRHVGYGPSVMGVGGGGQVLHPSLSVLGLTRNTGCAGLKAGKKEAAIGRGDFDWQVPGGRFQEVVWLGNKPCAPPPYIKSQEAAAMATFQLHAHSSGGRGMGIKKFAVYIFK